METVSERPRPYFARFLVFHRSHEKILARVASFVSPWSASFKRSRRRAIKRCSFCKMWVRPELVLGRCRVGAGAALAKSNLL